MAKLSNKSVNGTSFFNTVILSSVENLTRVLGQPQVEQNTGEEKFNFQWVCETEGGDVFTIYDWKEYREIRDSETVCFHIGGFSEAVTDKAKDELVRLLNKFSSLPQ